MLSPPGKSTSLKRSPSSLSAVSESSIDSFRHKKTGTTVTDSPPMSPSNKDKGVSGRNDLIRLIINPSQLHPLR